MNEEHTKDFLFVLYMIIIFALAIVYFAVPERTVFLDNVIDWWASVFDIIR